VFSPGPAALHRGMGIYVLRYDDNVLADYSNATHYLTNKTVYSSMSYLDTGSWTIPFVTGHKYKIHFGATGLDYETLTVTIGERWEVEDQSIYFFHNFTDVRVENKFTLPGGWVMPNNTIAANPADWQFGQNLVLNETAIRETHFIINGKNQSGHPY